MTDGDRDPRAAVRRIGALTVVLGSALAFLGAAAVATYVKMQRDDVARHEAAEILVSVREEIQRQLHQLSAVAALYDSSEFVSRHEFDLFTSEILGQTPAIQALEWAPRVPAGERAEYEALAAAEGLPGFRIVESAPDGRMTPVAPRAEYFPVFYVSPLGGNEAALGFDLASRPGRREALNLARDTGALAATSLIELVQNAEAPAAILVLAPVFAGGRTPDSVAARRETLAGYALAVLHIDSIFRVAEQHGDGEMAVVAFDESAGAEAVTIYRNAVARDLDIADERVAESGGDMAVALGDRTWRIVVAAVGPASPYLIWQAWAAAAMILLFSGLVGLYSRAMASRGFEIERLVNDREVKHRTIFEAAVVGIVTTDAAGTIVEFNPGAERVFGYSSEDVRGARIFGLLPMLSEESLFGGDIETEGRRKDGTSFPVSLAISEMSLDGKRMSTAIVQDITERRRADEMKNEFVSTVSHELRTPLTSIKGALGLARSQKLGALPKPLASMIDIAYRNADRLVRLINDILDIEKIEAGKMEFRMTRIDLASVVESAVEANQGLFEEQQVAMQLTREVPSAWVDGDPDRLVQVISNLLSNAAKFSRPGDAVRVSVSLQGRVCRVSVADHGSGIPDEFRARIFRKFEQADSTDTRQAGGTGLGLSICKAIVEHHGGTIDFESVPGYGAMFYFDLPVLSSAALGGAEEQDD